MRVFVTGAGGYLGRELVRRLASGGHEVVTRSLRDRAWEPALHGVEVIAHLAGVKERTADAASLNAMIEANISLTQRLLDAARTVGVARVVFASSYRVYGRHTAHELPCTEDSEARPIDAYGMSKWLAEELVRSSGLSHVILRLTNIFGVGETGLVSRDVVWAMIHSAFHDGVIRVQGHGEQTLDLMPLADAGVLMQHAIERLTTERLMLNAGSGVAITVQALAHMIADIFQELYGSTIAIRHVSGNSSGCSRAVTVERMRQWLGPVPQQQLTDALRRDVMAHERALAAVR